MLIPFVNKTVDVQNLISKDVNKHTELIIFY